MQSVFIPREIEESEMAKEAPQISWLAVGSPKTHRLWGAERAALPKARRAGVPDDAASLGWGSEDKKYEAKPTPAKPILQSRAV